MNLRRHSHRFLKFGLVGGSGVLVNLAAYTLFFKLLGIPDFLARIGAIEVAVLSNFTLNNLWTWSDRAGQRPPLGQRLLRYHGSTLLASQVIPLAVGALLLVLLKPLPWEQWAAPIGLLAGWRGEELARLASHFGGIALGMLVNYVLSDRWVFLAPPRRGETEEQGPPPPGEL